MARRTSTDVKEVVFVRGAEEAFHNLPTAILKEASSLLDGLQNGRIPTGGRYKELTGNAQLRGIAELRLNGEDGNTYRVYEIINRREVIYVLDAGAKKSTRRGEIRDKTSFGWNCASGPPM